MGYTFAAGGLWDPPRGRGWGGGARGEGRGKGEGPAAPCASLDDVQREPRGRGRRRDAPAERRRAAFLPLLRWQKRGSSLGTPAPSAASATSPRTVRHVRHQRRP